MMNQQPDELFRRSFEHYKKPAPEGAWSRIEKNLRAERKSSWLKIAASLLIFAAAAGLIGHYLTKKASSPKITAEAEETVKPRASTQAKPTEEPAEVQAGNNAEDPSTQRSERRRTPATRANGNADVVPQERNQAPQSNVFTVTENNIATTTGSAMPPPDSASLPLNMPLATASDTPDGQSEDAYKLVVHASEVNSKYLIKKEIAQATDSVKKSSGIRKLLDKAQELKHNQDALADLRQMKNEILAFNFQKQDQNK